MRYPLQAAVWPDLCGLLCKGFQQSSTHGHNHLPHPYWNSPCSSIYITELYCKILLRSIKSVSMVCTYPVILLYSPFVVMDQVSVLNECWINVWINNRNGIDLQINYVFLALGRLIMQSIPFTIGLTKNTLIHVFYDRNALFFGDTIMKWAPVCIC